jgi:hypothetical protein
MGRKLVFATHVSLSSRFHLPLFIEAAFIQLLVQASFQ